MTRKTPECYLAVFEYIEQNLFEMKPAEIMTDYEDGMRLAIKRYWPNVVIRGCWFHMARAVNKRHRRLGLSKIKNKNRKIIKRMLLCIPLLAADRIQEGFQAIIAFAKKKRLFKRFAMLFKYFERYWLNNQVTFVKKNYVPARI